MWTLNRFREWEYQEDGYYAYVYPSLGGNFIAGVVFHGILLWEGRGIPDLGDAMIYAYSAITSDRMDSESIYEALGI